MWTAKTDAEQQPWFDEYLELRRLDPDFNDNNGEQKTRRKTRTEADRLKSVAQLQLIEQQNAKGEELVFSDNPDEIARLLEEHQHSSLLENNNKLPDDHEGGFQGLPGAAGLGIEMNQDFGVDLDLNLNINQHHEHEQEVAAQPENLNHDFEFLDQDLNVDGNFNNFGFYLDFEQE